MKTFLYKQKGFEELEKGLFYGSFTKKENLLMFKKILLKYD